MLHSNTVTTPHRKARIILEDENILSRAKNLFLSDFVYDEICIERLELFKRRQALFSANPQQNQTYWMEGGWKQTAGSNPQRKYFSTHALVSPNKYLRRMRYLMNRIRQSSIDDFHLTTPSNSKVPLLNALSRRERSIPHLDRKNTTKVFFEMMKMFLSKLSDLSRTEDEIWEVELGTQNWLKQRIEVEMDKQNNNAASERNLLSKDESTETIPSPVGYGPRSKQVIYFWGLDTDGLELSVPLLNQGQSISVTPLKPFFELRLNTQWGESSPPIQMKDNFLHLLTERNGGRMYSDHFVLLLQPNFEIFDYDTTSIDEERRRTWENEGEQLFGCSFISSNQRALYVWLDEERTRIHVENLFDNPNLAGQSKLYFSVNEQQRSSLFESKNQGFLDTLLTGSIYLKKQHIGGKNNYLPFRNRNRLLKSREISPNFQLVKWTYFRTKNTDRINRRHVGWSEHNRCGSPTLMALKSPDSQFGFGINGKKPCSRKLLKRLRCHHHR
jgi:hypothetical protein